MKKILVCFLCLTVYLYSSQKKCWQSIQWNYSFYITSQLKPKAALKLKKTWKQNTYGSNVLMQWREWCRLDNDVEISSNHCMQRTLVSDGQLWLHCATLHKTLNTTSNMYSPSRSGYKYCSAIFTNDCWCLAKTAKMLLYTPWSIKTCQFYFLNSSMQYEPI